MNINTLNNNSGNPQPQFNCREMMVTIWKSIPLFVRFVIISTCAIYILNWLIPLGYIFANIPWFVVFRVQIWRLFTNSFVTTSIFSVLFSFLSWVKDASNLESQMGTMKYMLMFMINSVIIQIAYTFLLFVFYMIFKEEGILSPNSSGTNVVNSGLWPIILAEMTMLCLANPETPMRFFLLPCQIKSKYYPLVLLGTFFILSGFMIQLDIIVGALYGAFYHYFIRTRFQIKDSFVEKLENCVPFKYLKKNPSYVPCKNAFGSSGSGVIVNNNSSSNTEVSTGNSSPQIQDAPAPPTFKPFQGKGVAVGGVLGTTNGEYEGVSQNNQI